MVGLFRPRKANAPTEAPAPDAQVRAQALRLIEEGNHFEDRGQAAEALSCYDAAVRLCPGFAKAHLNRGNALMALQQPEPAQRALLTALELEPGYAAAHFNLGNVYTREGRWALAIHAYREAIRHRPNFVDAEVAKGAAHEELGQLVDAAASFRRAATTDPQCVDAYVRMGRVLAALGDPAASLEAYGRALVLRPDGAQVHNEVGLVRQRLGQLDVALNSYRRAIALDPRYAEAYSNAGNVELKLGRVAGAVEAQRRAVEIKPGLAEAHCNLGSALKDSGNLHEAEVSYRQSIDLRPGFAHAHVGLGDVLKDLGRLDEAAACFRRAIELAPDLEEAYTSLLFCLSLDESVPPGRLFVEHRAFGEHFERPWRGAWPNHANGREPERVLRVGLVSGDFRAHAMAYFIEPLLEQLVRRPTLLLYVYNNHAVEDQVTERMRRHVPHWHRVAGITDEDLAAQIVSDGIDILVDLSGHTSENRLRTFAHKPAPIQTSWIGYLGTTGLAAVDYYLADGKLFPIDSFAGQFTEKIVHLPVSAPFLPDGCAPPVNALPALTNGHVTFGSFNQPRKLRPTGVTTWARLMEAVPDSRLLLGAVSTEDQAHDLVEMFVNEGVRRDRIEPKLRCDMAAYLHLHHRVDVCLDTFPYGGGATTAHALWMGVPTLTLAGLTPVGRLGAAILGHVGLETFVVRDRDEFVRRGIAVASDLSRLAELRQGLRPLCANSPLHRADAVAVGFERAMRMMWRRWCAGLAPETFVLDP